MGDGKEVTPEKKSRRVPRWAKVMTGLILIWMVLNTEINLNPPLESLADPNVDVEAAIEKKTKGTTPHWSWS